MGRGSTRKRLLAVALLAGTVAGIGVVEAAAQLLPGGEGSGQPVPTSDQTTTTAPPSTTTTTAPIGGLLEPQPPPPTSAPPPSSGEPQPTTPPPSGAPDPGEGDAGQDSTGAGRAIPPAAQAVIDAIARTPPGTNDALVQGAAAVEAAGVAHDDAVRAVFGRFPVLGPTRWSDDWYSPRWTGSQFRFHQGLDMFAPYGTPVAAPVDGIARIGNNALGGLTVKVVEPDGTYWYLAHLSGIAEGLVDGQPVTTGQVVGFVGTSGNAVGTPPHLHFGVYPQGGGAAPPKPVVDAWVADGAARVPQILAQLGAAPAPPATPIETAIRAIGTEVGPPTASGPSRTDLLWASAASPTGGAVQVADAAAAAVGQRVDWERRAAEQRALDVAWAHSVDRAGRLLSPLTNPTLRRAVEGLRATAS